MAEPEQNKRSNQVVGNAGLYYVCYELTKLGWNVLPTSRNAKGVDLVIYNKSATRTHTIQIKSLSKGSPVPVSKDSLMAEFLIVCRKVFENKPEVFLAKTEDVKPKIDTDTNEAREESYWLQPNAYEEYKDNWDIIGRGD